MEKRENTIQGKTFKHGIRDIFSFALCETAVFIVFSLFYYHFHGFPGSFSGISFALLQIPAISFQFSFVLTLIAAAFFLIYKKSSFPVCVALGSFFNILLLIDVFVYGQYHFHINLAMLRLFFGPARKEIFDFPASMYFMFVLAVLLMAAASYFLAKQSFAKPIKGKTAAAFFLIMLFVFGAYNVRFAYAKYVFLPEILSQGSVLPLTYPLSMNSRMRKMGFKPRQADFEESSEGRFAYPLENLSFDESENKNILIIAVDALRFDMFSKEIMPNTYQIAQKYGFFNFKNHISGGNATSAGIISLFYSLPFSYWDVLNGIRPVLLKTAAENNYDFGIFASARLDSPDFTKNVFYGIQGLRIGSAGNSSAERDEDASGALMKFMDGKEKGKKFFAFLFLDSPHAYSMPENYQRPFQPSQKVMNYMLLNNNSDPVPYLNLYKNSVHYVDSLIGRVLSKVEEKGLLENTIVVITGDHGQEMNESHNNRWGHNSNYSDWQTKVPMLVYVPGLKGGDRDYRTAHYDIVPTLMGRAFGCTSDYGAYSLGRDIISGYNAPEYGGKGRPYTVIATYTAKAVREGDTVSEFSNYGTINNFDGNDKPQKQGVNTSAIKNALKDFAKFYK